MPDPGTVRDGRIFRHRLSTRAWHWINAVTVIVMLMSGLTISNAHPWLYWGHFGSNFDKAWLALPRFPGWMTIPTGYNLALAREWHFAFAWVLSFALLLYMLRSLWNGHFRRDIALSAKEVAPSHLIEDVKRHLRFRFETPGGSYNPLQKIAYSSVLFVLLPVLILTGLTLSPGMNAVLPWLIDLFGGRQSARSIHFICATGIAAFIFVHLLLVIAAGPTNEIRSMITGWFRTKGDAA